MNETTYTMQLSYMLDTDSARFRDLMSSPPASRARLVEAGIESARRRSGHSAPRGSGAGASWKPFRLLGCCACAVTGKLLEHCRGAQHVAAEYGLSEAAVPLMESMAQLLERTRLSGALPQELNENGLRVAILGALNDSWRRLYREPTSRADNNEERRLTAGMKSSADVFAERISRRAVRPSPLALSSVALKAPRMLPTT